MSAFEDACAVEAAAASKYLMPFLRRYSSGLVTTEKGRLSRELQVKYGDVFLNSSASGEFVSVELKAERVHTGNLFIETWSNRRTRRRGRLDHLDADLLFYFFLDSEMLYCIDLPGLQDWAFGKDPGLGHLQDFREVRQGCRVQHNDTWGRLVPVAVVLRAVKSTAWSLSNPSDPLPCPIEGLDRRGVPSPVAYSDGSLFP